jgi:hypothetical protein
MWPPGSCCGYGSPSYTDKLFCQGLGGLKLDTPVCRVMFDSTYPLQLHVLGPPSFPITVGLFSVCHCCCCAGIHDESMWKCTCATISITTVSAVVTTARSSSFIALDCSLFFHHISRVFTMADVEKTEPVSQIDGNAPQGMRYIHIDPTLQKRVVRKLDFNLMPMVMALCKSCYARTVIHQVRLTGLTCSQRPHVFP